MKLVIMSVFVYETPQSGDWNFCFKASAGSGSNEFNDRKKYEGNNLDLRIRMPIEGVSVGNVCSFSFHLDDDVEDVCTNDVDDLSTGTFVVSKSGSKTYNPKGDWSYKITWELQ